MTDERWMQELFRGELEVCHLSHPPDAVLLGYRWESLQREEMVAVGVHLSTCERCRTRVTELGGAQTWSARPSFLQDPRSPAVVSPSWRQDGRRTGHADARVGVVPSRVWRTVLVHAGMVAGVALLMGAVHWVLDWKHATTTSPLATPVQTVRWWVHLYWGLLPLAAAAALRTMRVLRRGKEDAHEKD
jgi:predicted anti-sigma-YlaC factor YlaD